MRITIKRKIVVRLKTIISKIVLFFLYKGFKVTRKNDFAVKSEIESWEDGFTVCIDAGASDVKLIIKKENDKLIRLKQEDESNIDLKIIFKSIDVAFLMFTGRLGVSKAYAEHRFILKGEISKAMSFVRCIDIVEAYLFPKFITQNILKEIPKKTMGILRTYEQVLVIK